VAEVLTLLNIVGLHLHVVHELRRLIVRGVQVLVRLYVASRCDGGNSILGEFLVGKESYRLHIVSIC
jgi:hypothetical protein